jgi:hypothetical protein
MDTLRPRSTPRGFPRIPPLPPLGYLHNFHSDLSHIVTPGTTGAFPETNCSRNSDCRTLSPAEEQRGANRFPRAMVRKIAGSIRRPVGSGRGGEAAEFFISRSSNPHSADFKYILACGSLAVRAESRAPILLRLVLHGGRGGSAVVVLEHCDVVDEPTNPAMTAPTIA